MNKYTIKKTAFKGIMFKLIVLYLALVFIVMIVSGTFIYMDIKENEATKVEAELASNAKRIDDSILKKVFDVDAMEKELSNTITRSNLECVILDSQGNTLVPRNSRFTMDSVVFGAMAGKPTFQPWVKGAGPLSEDDLRNKVWFNYAVPINGTDGKTQYIIYIAMNAEDAMLSLNSVTDTITVAVAIAMVLAVVLGSLFSSTLTGPISALTKIAGEMAKGNLDQQIPVKSDDEIGQLTQSFNNMAQSLDKTLSDMSSEKSRIEIILNNMTDGVLAYDNLNHLIHANYASTEMLGIDDIENKGFSEIMGILGIGAQQADAFSSDSETDSTVELNRRYISFNYSAYKNSQNIVDGVVIVLQDVTRHTKLDNMRREFVANVSHELRTPLTTIKSYTETLLDGALDDKELARSFLTTVDSETDRMTFLTTDLLELSRFDNKQLNMEMEETNLISIIHNCIRQNTVLAQNKNQNILFNPEDTQMFIMCDPSRINQVINNVLSNSIKYSGENSTITISTNSSGKYYKVFIKDEGLGIPKEDLKRIFERFYRVDKARSRAMGGTGLGLAIAKEIMDAHEGHISATSGEDKGTTMVLRFKKLNC